MTTTNTRVGVTHGAGRKGKGDAQRIAFEIGSKLAFEVSVPFFGSQAAFSGRSSAAEKSRSSPERGLVR